MKAHQCQNAIVHYHQLGPIAHSQAHALEVLAYYLESLTQIFIAPQLLSCTCPPHPTSTNKALHLSHTQSSNQSQHPPPRADERNSKSPRFTNLFERNLQSRSLRPLRTQSTSLNPTVKPLSSTHPPSPAQDMAEQPALRLTLNCKPLPGPAPTVAVAETEAELRRCCDRRVGLTGIKLVFSKKKWCV